ncbi:MAG: OmpA family protein [Deltaproteobacteria bacterium]|nr:OmpA family protein [Deltaproteobacteria bacterium]
MPRGVTRGAIVLTIILLSGRTQAESGLVNLHLEPAVGLLVTAPQSDRFGVGGGGAIKLEIAPGERIGFQVMAAAMAFRDGTSPDPALGVVDPGAGGLMMAGGGVRLRPFNDHGGYAIHVGGADHHRGNLFGNLWLDADVGYVRTGPKNRLGFDAAIGLELSVMDGLQVGPYAKYLQVVEMASQLEPEDARIVLAGLSFSVGGGAVHPSDRDGDGLIDEVDRCPDDAEDPDGFEDEDGCPELDNDHDDIPDNRDRCPLVPEDPDGFEDHDGCPEPGPAQNPEVPVPETRTEERDEEADILLEQRVHFDTAKARVRTRFRPLVRQVQALMDGHPEFLRIRIEGHADERGTRAYNQWLSTERARRAAVVLQRYGVDPARIEIIGYGRDRPLAPGRSERALYMNRRVDFRIILVRRQVQVGGPEAAPPISDEPPAGPAAPAASDEPPGAGEEPAPPSESDEASER